MVSHLGQCIIPNHFVNILSSTVTASDQRDFASALLQPDWPRNEARIAAILCLPLSVATFWIMFLMQGGKAEGTIGSIAIHSLSSRGLISWSDIGISTPTRGNRRHSLEGIYALLWPPTK